MELIEENISITGENPKLYVCSNFQGKIERKKELDEQNFICYTLWVPKNGTMISDHVHDNSLKTGKPIIICFFMFSRKYNNNDCGICIIN